MVYRAVLLLIFSNLSNATFENLQPLFERGTYLILKGNFSIISYTLETVILLFLFPYVTKKAEATQAYIKGITAGLFLLIVISIFALAVSGFAVLKMQLYPSYMLGQALQLSFFNHIEVVIAIIWFISLFFKVVICFFVLTQGLSELLKVQEYRVLTFPLGMLIFVCSILFISNNTYLGDFISSTWISYSITYGFLFPLCLLILSWGRSKLRN
ncbi:GerAB/ArcD/ProY family transporter [Priestia megaterium]|nr:GerAB/ArcD/ProY family transporter [Priestia megaterium]